MPANGNSIPELFAKWFVKHPRRMGVLSLFGRAVMGTLVGLVIGLIIPAAASNFDDELFLFVVSLAILIGSKVLGQLFWITKLRPWAPRLILPVLDRLRIPHDKNLEVPLELSSKLSLTVTVVSTTGIATILATEYVPSGWFSGFSYGPWIPAMAGAMIAPLQTLSSPSMLFVLWRNSYPLQQDKRS